MGPADFIQQMRDLGFEVQELPQNGYIQIDYEVDVGPATGRNLKLVLQPPPDWPASPPSGPRISPRLLPLHPDQSVGHPYGGVHPADELGPDWQYWSRPCPCWPQTDRTAQAYMAHLRRLFDTLPDDL